MKIRLNNSTDAKTVVSIANKFKDCDIDGSIGRCIIDLKSILGVLSFGLPKVIDVTVRSDDKALVKEFEDSVMFWRCDDCKLRSNGMPVPLLRNGYSIFNGTKYR